MSEAGQQKALLVLDANQGWKSVKQVALSLGPRHHLISAAAANAPPAASKEAWQAIACERLEALAPDLRSGDRILVVVSDPDDPALVDAAAAARLKGAAVELRVAAARSSSEAASSSSDAAHAADETPDLQQPEALLRRYAHGKNLPEPLVNRGAQLLKELASEAASATPSLISLRLERISLQGFGSFRERQDYPLHKRGLVLLQGAHRAKAATGGAAETTSADGGAHPSAQVDALDPSGAMGGGAAESNGAGKTTLAMASLWALTGNTDARANGRSIESKGVINDECDCAMVELSGSLDGDAEGASPPGEGGASTAADACRVKFSVKRTVSRRSSMKLSFIFNGKDDGGGVTDVQKVLESKLRVSQLARVAFFGQHLQGGLLDMTDKYLREQLQALLPMEVWEKASARAKELAAEEDKNRQGFDGELKANTGQIVTLATQEAVAAEKAKHWEEERQGDLARFTIQLNVEAMELKEALKEALSAVALEAPLATMDAGGLSGAPLTTVVAPGRVGVSGGVSAADALVDECTKRSNKARGESEAVAKSIKEAQESLAVALISERKESRDAYKKLEAASLELVAAARSATDTIRYLELPSECTSAKHAAAVAQDAVAAARAACDKQIRALELLCKGAAYDSAQTRQSVERVDKLCVQLKGLEESRAATQAEEAEWTQQRHAAEMRAEKHRVALKALEARQREPNPHALRISDAAAQRADLALRQEKLAVDVTTANEEKETLSKLSDHFGKKGVQNLLYKLALENLECRANGYAGKLSGGKLQLLLAFDKKEKTITKKVQMRSEEGGCVERSVNQLSGGEWRRLALALSLAFADFAKQRTALGCNLLVLDEVMANMDAAGQRAMASVLQELGGDIDTVLVIAHGLRDETLSGHFKCVDTVVKEANVSKVRFNDELRL